jgi:hypothetical protein
MPEDRPLVDALAEMTAVAINRSSLGARDHMMARLAALIAADAPAASYLINAGTARDVGITLEDVRGLLIAVAPIAGTARVVTASGNIVRALGFAVAVAEEAEREAAAAKRA